jgi:hypothetical protein
MAHFVSTIDGRLINLDHVVMIRSKQNKGDDDVLEMTEGSGRTTIHGMLLPDLDQLDGALIPASPPGTATVFWYNAWSGGARPTEVFQRLEPIIAWRDEGPYLEPVFLQELAPHSHPYLRFDKGCYRELAYDGAIYDSLEEVKAAILCEAQGVWDGLQARCEAEITKKTT